MQEIIPIPGTISDEAKRIRWYRDKDTPEGLRTYKADVSDGQLRAIVSHDEVAAGKFLWHISVSHNKEGRPDRCPNWDELKHAKYQLLGLDIAMVLIFPKRTAEYVNIYDTCLHLWESTEKEIDE